MPICRICNQEFTYINAPHLKTHGWTLEAYKKKWPEAELGTGRKLSRKKKPTKKWGRLSVGEDGKVGGLQLEVEVLKRFKIFREERKMSTSDMLNSFMDVYEKYEENSELDKIIEKTTKDSKAVPKDFILGHRDKLQQLLMILEERALHESNTTTLANLTDKIARINQILPQLEKSYSSDLDKKIEEMIESRKQICRNWLPEAHATPKHSG